MVIDFNQLTEITIQHLNGGDGSVTAKMFRDEKAKVMESRLPKGTSIGVHQHETSSEFDYVLSGQGKAICDETEEKLVQGVCHYCPKGKSHSIVNTGENDLVLLTIVAEQN